MKNINKWDSLSIKDKADLMKLYIKNGINNLEEIRSHYNKYADGGYTEEDEEYYTVPTRQEYLEEVKRKALEASNSQGVVDKKPKTFVERLLENGQSARDSRIGAVGTQQIRDLYKDGKTKEAQNLADKYYKANTAGIALGAGFASPNLYTDLGITFGTTLLDAVPNYMTNDKKTATKNTAIDLASNAAFDLLGHGVGKLINKGVDLYKAKKSVSQIPDNIFENMPGLTYEVTPRLNSPSPTLGLPPHRNPVLYFEHSGSRAIDRDAYERLLRDANFNEGSINNLLREFDDRIRSRSMGSNEDFLLYRYPVNGTMTLDPMLVDFSHLNLPQGFRTPNSTIMYNGTPLTRQEAIDYLTSRGFNDAYIENKLNLFDTEFYNQNTPSSVFPSIDFDLSVSAYGPGHLSDATESFIRNNVDRYEDTILRRSFTAEDAGGVRNEFNFANSITNKTKEHRILTEELSKKYPELKPYLQEGKPIDDTLRKFLWDKYGLESPLNIDDMTWFQGNAGAEYIWGREPMYKKLVRDKDGNLVKEIRKESPGKRQAGLATLKYIKEMPRHTAITVTNTSLDSELLKLNGAVRNYGTGPGQTTVEIMPSGYSLGNDHHLERIYLEDILNDGNIDPSEVSTLRDYMDKRRNGARANIPDISSLPTFSKAAEDYYYKYTKKHMVDRLSDYWEQIKKLDSRYENVEMPSVGDFDLTKLNTILYTGEYSPYIKRTPVAVVKHKDGGKLNKLQDGGNKVLKSTKPIYNNWQEVINDGWYKNIQDNTYIGTVPYKSMYQNKDAITKLPKNTTIDNFINVMYPIVEQSMISKGKSLKNVDNMVKQIAYESNYGRSSRGNGYNLAGIKEFDSSKPRTKYKDGQYYKDFSDYRDFADYYVDLVTNRYEVENADNLKDYVDRLHGKNSSGKSYSTNKKYYKDMKNMKTLDKKIKDYKK